MCVSDMLAIEGNGGNVLPLLHTQLMTSETHLFPVDLMACLYVQRREALGHHEAAKWGAEALGARPFLKLLAAISCRLLV